MRREKLKLINSGFSRDRLGLKRLVENFSLDEEQALFAVTVIFILAFLLRIYKLGYESLWLDEAFSINFSKRSAMGFLQINSQDTNPPLYYIVLHFWMNLFGDSEFSVRFPSLIFGVVSVYVIYRLGKLIFNNEIGIISALVLSLSLFHIRYSQEARFYSLLTLSVLLSNYYFVKMVKERTTKYTAAYVVSTAVMAYTHIFGLFYILVQNIYYLFIFRKNIQSWVAIQGVLLLFFAPWTAVITRIMGRIGTGSGIDWIPQPTYISLYDTFRIFAGSKISLYVFIILCIAGLSSNNLYNRIKPHEFNDRVFLLLWLFLPILMSVIISLIYQPIYQYKYAIGCLPALILLVSKGVFNFKKNSIILILIVVLILLAVSPLERYYQTPDKEQWREVASYIEHNKSDNDFVILYISNTQTPFKYYYKNDSNFIGVYGAYQIKNRIDGYEGIWLVLSHDWSPEMRNQSKLIEKTLAEKYVKQYTVNFTDIKLNYYLTNKYETDQAQPDQSSIIYLTGKNTKIAQSFVPAERELDAIQLKTAELSDEVKVYIQTDNGGGPSGNTVGNIITTIPNRYMNLTVKVGRIELEPNNKYWIIVERTKGNISLYGEGANNNKVLKIYDSTKDLWRDSWNWGNTSGNGLYFKTLILNRTTLI